MTYLPVVLYVLAGLTASAPLLGLFLEVMMQAGSFAWWTLWLIPGAIPFVVAGRALELLERATVALERRVVIKFGLFSPVDSLVGTVHFTNAGSGC